MTTDLTPIENAQIRAAASSAASVVAAARDLVVEDSEQASRAGEILRDLATVKARAERERKAIQKPYLDKVETIRAQYREPASMLDEADRTIRAKVQAFAALQEAERRYRQRLLDEQAAIQRKADEAERDRLAAEAKAQSDAWAVEIAEREAKAQAEPSPESEASVTAARRAQEALDAVAVSRAITPLPVRQVEVAAPVAKPTQGVSTRKTWTFTVEDPDRVPPCWKVIDEPAIRTYMHATTKAKMTPDIPGVRFWQETGMTVRGR